MVLKQKLNSVAGQINQIAQEIQIRSLPRLTQEEPEDPSSKTEIVLQISRQLDTLKGLIDPFDMSDTKPNPEMLSAMQKSTKLQVGKLTRL